MVQAIKSELRAEVQCGAGRQAGEEDSRQFGLTVAFLYCLSLITTIGPGPHQTPRSAPGKLIRNEKQSLPIATS